jgi:hypothetical protein
VLPSGRWKKVPGNGRCSGLATCSGFGACAHRARLVRVDVAAHELHVAARDVEAAALPEDLRSHSEGCVQGKWFHWGTRTGREAGMACAAHSRGSRLDVHTATHRIMGRVSSGRGAMDKSDRVR